MEADSVSDSGDGSPFFKIVLRIDMDKIINLYHVTERILNDEVLIYKAYATDVRHVLELLDEYEFQLTPAMSIILIEKDATEEGTGCKFLPFIEDCCIE